MPNLNNDLNKAELLLNEGKDYEAIPILNKIAEDPTLSLTDEVALSSLFIRVGNWEKVIKISEQIYQKAKYSRNYLLLINAILNMAYASIIIGDLDKSSKFLEESEELSIILSKDHNANIESLEAYEAYIKGYLYFFLGNKEDSLKYMGRSLELREIIGNKQEIAESLLGLANCYRLLEMDFNKAFDYTHKGLKIAEELHHQRLIAYSYFCLGGLYYFRGELEKSLSYYKRVLPYFERTNNLLSYLGTMNNMALIYRAQGKLDKSIELLSKCIELSEDSKNSWNKVGYNVSMVEVCLDKGDIEKAKEHSAWVRQISDRENNPYLNRDYIYTEALILKKSPRIQNRAKAENLLRTLIQDEDSVFEHKIEGSIHLCDLLIDELRLTHEIEIIKEIKPLIRELLVLTEKSHSYWYYVETYVLQAKLALITLDIKTARQLLTKAQNIAQEYGFEQLVKKVSSEHDELLQKLDLWEKLKDSKSPVSDRLKLTNLDDQLKIMIQKRRSEIPEVIDEIPIMILVISEGGIPTFSKSFAETFIVEDDLLSSFLAAFNTFSGELFSEGLDRASFGEYTLIIKPISSFLVCYLFKGQSYSALKRIEKFIEGLSKNKDVLDKFHEYKITNRMIKNENLTDLESLIKEIFLN